MRELKHKYIPGNPWMICDECGLRYRKSETLIRWDHAVVCQKCWEPKHPQESVRVKADKIRVHNPRPDTYSELDLVLGVYPTVINSAWSLQSDGSYACNHLTGPVEMTWIDLVTIGEEYTIELRSIFPINAGSVYAEIPGIGTTEHLTSIGTVELSGTVDIVGHLTVTGDGFSGSVFISVRKDQSSVTRDDL